LAHRFNGFLLRYLPGNWHLSLLDRTSITYPDRTCHTGLGAISIIFSACYMGALIGIIFGGRVYDRIRGHPIMTVILVLVALLTALMPLSNVLWQLALIFLLLGFASGTLHVGGNTLLGRLPRPASKKRMLSALY
jgi:MFS family permease